MRDIALMIILSIGFLKVNGQILIVKDATTRTPIENAVVEIVSTGEKQTTNSNGQVQLKLINKSDLIIVRMMGYRDATINAYELDQIQYVVYLNPNPVNLPEFKFSESRWENKNKIDPGQISVVDRADVEFYNPQTSAEMLEDANVFVQRSQMGGGSPMIRGFAANRVLIVVDGVRMNNAIFRSGNLHNIISVDPFIVEHAEVFFGPSSVAYGSDALGGTMLIKTFEPNISITDKIHVSGRSLTRWSYANDEKTNHLMINIGGKKLASLTAFGFSDFGDLRMGSKGPDDYLRNHYVIRVNERDYMVENSDPQLQKFTAYDAYNLMQKFLYKPSSRLSLTYSLIGNVTSNIPRYDRLIEYQNNTLRSAEWYYGPQRWFMNSIAIDLALNNKLFDNGQFIVSHQWFEESRIDRRFQKNWLRTQRERVQLITFNADMMKKLTDKMNFIYGIDLAANKVCSKAWRDNIVTGANEPIGTRYPDNSTLNNIAAYGLLKMQIAPKLYIPIGLRYTYVMADAVFDTTFYPFPFVDASVRTGALNGSSGITFVPSDRVIIKWNLSTGFRAPNIDDIGKVFDSEPGKVVVPNPDLSHEYAYASDLGIITNLGNLVRFDVFAYYTHLDNAMVRRDYTLNGQDSMLYDGQMSKIQAIQNAAFAYVYGLSANVEVKLPLGFAVLGSLNWQKGEEEMDDGTKSPLRHAAPMFARAKISYNYKRFNIEGSYIYNAEIKHEDLAISEIGKPHLYAKDENGNPWCPSWYTFNVRAGMELSHNMTLYCGVLNITDQRYRPYSSGIVSAGRNYVVSLVTRF